MLVRVLFFFLIILFSSHINAQKVLKQGMRISSSTKFRKASYQFTSPDFQKPVLIVTGNNIVVDFNQVELKGSKINSPDQFTGIAVVIENGKNITIKNLSAKGYKIALLAKNVSNLVIENCNFSYNYRQHLNSTQQKENISDWMSYHQNEKDEWQRYGAAMYLSNCNNAVIKNNRVTGGQNALMMTACNDGMIYNNDFSFNSGIGIGMYKSSRNKLLFNKLNFNVRGYSHGVYNRGQDSAGFLVYEQSSDNLFYKNSATHSGDGFFLWAGQTTMDTGKGGCNDNLLLRNDFSYAPTNGIEVTFSRNKIIKNKIFECDHGIWGGYSYNTQISDNQFRNNRIGIAIEHGQENRIHHNLFINDKEAVRLWARKEQPTDWGYAKNRDTKSRNYLFVSNSFNKNGIALNFNRTDSIIITGNRFTDCTENIKKDSTVTNIDDAENEDLHIELSNEEEFDIPEIKDPIDPFIDNGKYAGRKNIMITEWGPYDFRYPIIWNTNPTDTSSKMEFDILGPAGNWKIVSVNGVKDLSLNSGKIPAKISATKIVSDITDIIITAEFIGSGITTAFGEKVVANKPYRFSFKKFFQPINWNVAFYKFDSLSNPIKKSVELKPDDYRFLKQDTLKSIDYAWWGGVQVNGKEEKKFVTIANGESTLQPGNYELGVTWDDAVRVYVDDKLVLDEWNPSLYKFDESPHKKINLKLGGKHHFKVEHVELGGFATLSVKIKKLEN